MLRGTVQKAPRLVVSGLVAFDITPNKVCCKIIPRAEERTRGIAFLEPQVGKCAARLISSTK
jgi:hypothetical protein